MPRKKGTEKNHKKKAKLMRFQFTYSLVFSKHKAKVVIYATGIAKAQKEFWSRLDESFHNLVSVSDITFMEAE